MILRHKSIFMIGLSIHNFGFKIIIIGAVAITIEKSTNRIKMVNKQKKSPAMVPYKIQFLAKSYVFSTIL